jgi:hypothetical protein
MVDGQHVATSYFTEEGLILFQDPVQYITSNPEVGGV